MTTYTARALVWVAVFLSACATGETPAPEAPVEQVRPPPPAPPPPPQPEVVVHEVAPGQSFGGIMERYGIGATHAIVKAARQYKDLARLRVGDEIHFTRLENRMLRFTYALGPERTLRVELPEDGPPQAHLDEQALAREIVRAEFALTSSLWDAALGAGLSPGDIVTLAEVFQYDVDFNTELRDGARFTVVFEELQDDDGERIRTEQIHAARLVNRGKTYTALRYVGADGQASWYDPEGKASSKPFLRNPLEFTRISSRFARRVDPFTKKIATHGGVDFSAPTGTAVRASGDGVVEVAGTNGGYGRYVRLDHGRIGPYKTAYAHLSKIEVKKGQRVRQGQIIGRVGSTGRSTGPHLHYEFHVRGKRVDPMTQKLPTSRALPKSELAAFRAAVGPWLARLDADQTALASAD